MAIQAETLIIGAGLVGSSTAMHLAELGMEKIRVVDFDLTGTLSSSELNAGGVRATWSQDINIELSKISIDFFAKNALDLGFKSCGYLWLHPKERVDQSLKAREKQLKHGWPVETWDLAELKRKVPFIDKTDGIELCLFAPKDGLVNPNLVKLHYRKKAQDKGVIFDDHILIKEVEYDKKDIRVLGEVFDYDFLAKQPKEGVLIGKDREPSGKFCEYRTMNVVNCTGPWAPGMARVMGYACPSFPVRRQVCIFDCRDVDLTPYGMIVDTSGVYFHPEAMNGLAGFATANEPKGMNFQYDESFFSEHIWPPLYERSTAFERLKHIAGWAGLYEVSPDESGIVGRVENGTAGKSGRIFEAHSFSGHGVMQSYAVGKLLAEKIVYGSYRTLDLGVLSGSRFEKNQLVRENMLI